MSEYREDIFDEEDGPEQNIFDPEAEAEEREREAESVMQRRIHREIIRIQSGEAEEELAEERERMAHEERERAEAEERDRRRERSLWRMITTGNFLTSSGAMQIYRYLIAIAVMCFFSIFLTFMSLNAERECRQMENYASVLRERSVLLEEERYSISSKGEIERMLQERGIVMIDLSSQSRLVDK